MSSFTSDCEIDLISLQNALQDTRLYKRVRFSLPTDTVNRRDCVNKVSVSTYRTVNKTERRKSFSGFPVGSIVDPPLTALEAFQKYCPSTLQPPNSPTSVSNVISPRGVHEGPKPLFRSCVTDLPSNTNCNAQLPTCVPRKTSQVPSTGSVPIVDASELITVSTLLTPPRKSRVSHLRSLIKEANCGTVFNAEAIS